MEPIVKSMSDALLLSTKLNRPLRTFFRWNSFELPCCAVSITRKINNV